MDFLAMFHSQSPPIGGLTQGREAQMPRRSAATSAWVFPGEGPEVGDLPSGELQ